MSELKMLPKELAEGELIALGEVVVIKPCEKERINRWCEDVMGKVGVVEKIYGDGDCCVDFGGNDWRCIPLSMCREVNKEMAFSSIRRNRIGGWTIVYPAYDDYQHFVWYTEKHYDANQLEMAWGTVIEKEDQYCQEYC